MGREEDEENVDILLEDIRYIAQWIFGGMKNGANNSFLWAQIAKRMDIEEC